MLFFKKSKRKDENNKSKNSLHEVAVQNGIELRDKHQENNPVIIERMPSGFCQEELFYYRKYFKV